MESTAANPQHAEIIPPSPSPVLLPDTSRQISVEHDAYGVLHYRVDRNRITLLPMLNAFAAHRHDWHAPINKVRPVQYHAIYDAHLDEAFPYLLGRIKTHLNTYRLHGILSFPVPSEGHHARVLDGENEQHIVRPLVGWWTAAHPAVGKTLDELLGGKHPSYSRLRPLGSREHFAEAPDYVLLSSINPL